MGPGLERGPRTSGRGRERETLTPLCGTPEGWTSHRNTSQHPSLSTAFFPKALGRAQALCGNNLSSECSLGKKLHKVFPNLALIFFF